MWDAQRMESYEGLRLVLTTLSAGIESISENDEDIVKAWRLIGEALKANGLDADLVDQEVDAELEDYLNDPLD